MVRAFVAEGAKVLAVDLDEAGLAKVADKTGCETLVANVADEDDIARIFDRDRVDILCNNAGILDGLTPLHDVSDELYAKVMKVNVEGPFKACRAAIPRMIEHGGGTILNTCSAAALSGGRAGSVYTISKHALLGLTRSTAWFYADKGIRCNAIAPGAIQTKMHMRLVPHQEGFEKYAKYFGTMPPHGKAAAVADVALFLVSDASRYVNGEIVSVDGGWNTF
jgi:NAD(P)-dependent dehydrogenase (short-subunit alcohol dehydrogenase family)